MLEGIREEFELLNKEELYYLDSAATSLKPKVVSEALARHYNLENGSPHRGAHKMSVRAGAVYDESKESVKDFVSAAKSDEVIYTKNSTESLNLIAFSLTEQINKGDKIVLTITAHHSNILPWQRLAKMTGAELVYLYCDDFGKIPESELVKIDSQTKILSFPLVSNGIGIIHSASKLIARAKAVGALVILDAAQAVGHIEVNFKILNADFLVFSGHKVYAPQGIGVLVAKKSALELLSPFLLGGDMIEYVTEQETTFAEIPKRFEAGTQNVGGALGLMTALNWLSKIGTDTVYQHEKELTHKLYQLLMARDDIVVYGTDNIDERGALVTFNYKNVHPHDVATILDSENIAIRAGHHCCQPLMKHLDIMASCRASIGIYNNENDLLALAKGLDKVGEVFGVGA